MTEEGSPSSQAINPRYQYAAKLLCVANIPGTSQTTTSVLPGAYQTAINIHNPNDQAVRLREKIALGPDSVSKFTEDELKPDAALRLDCAEIASRFGPFIHGAEGFLIIESGDSVDVTAVYTAAPVGGQVASVDVVQIRERVMGRG